MCGTDVALAADGVSSARMREVGLFEPLGHLVVGGRRLLDACRERCVEPVADVRLGVALLQGHERRPIPGVHTALADRGAYLALRHRHVALEAQRQRLPVFRHGIGEGLESGNDVLPVLGGVFGHVVEDLAKALDGAGDRVEVAEMVVVCVRGELLLDGAARHAHGEAVEVGAPTRQGVDPPPHVLECIDDARRPVRAEVRPAVVVARNAEVRRGVGVEGAELVDELAAQREHRVAEI